ncbi:MAG: ExbD/TolR family protein [Myxococcota bacterium]
MRFRSSNRRARGATSIDITSLVDVVFLLLIFLLVTTTFKRQEHAFPIELPTSSVDQVTVEADKTTVFISREGDLHFAVVPADAEEPADDGMTQAEKITREELQQRLRDLKQRRPNAAVAIRAEKDTSYQRLIDVVALAEDAGITNLWFPYELQGEE